MDNWTIEMRGDTLGDRLYICSYETKDYEKMEKLEKFFQALYNDSDSEEV